MSTEARAAAGYNLRLLQQGETLSMPMSRPMPTVGAGCHELRIGDIEQNVEWRLMYFVDDVAIVILEIWKNKTRRTPQPIIDACKARLSRYLERKNNR